MGPEENHTLNSIIDHMTSDAKSLQNTTVEYQKSRVLGDRILDYVRWLKSVRDNIEKSLGISHEK